MLGMIGKKEFYPHGRFYYRICGKPENKPLIFLHGYGGSPLSFKSVIQLLSQKFFVVAPYMSAKWGKYKIRDFTDSNFDILAEFLAELIDDLTVEKPIVLGYSMGSLLAVKLARKYPEKVKALVIVDGLVLAPEKTLWELSKKFFSGKARKEIFTRKGFKTFGMSIADFIKNLLLRPLVLFNQAVCCSRVNEECRIRDLEIKTLVLWGDKDELIPLDPFGKKIAELIKNSELETVPGEHKWGIANPELFFEKVVKFSETL